MKPHYEGLRKLQVCAKHPKRRRSYGIQEQHLFSIQFTVVNWTGKGSWGIYSKTLPTTHRKRKCCRDCSKRDPLFHAQKSGLWRGRGQELLSFPNTAFSSGENAQRRPLEFPHGESIFINFTALKDRFVLSGKKKKHILQSYDGNLRIALGAQVGAGMSRPHNPNDFLFQQQVTGDDQRGGLLNRPMEAGTWVLWHGAPGPSVLQTPP